MRVHAHATRSDRDEACRGRRDVVASHSHRGERGLHTLLLAGPHATVRRELEPRGGEGLVEGLGVLGVLLDNGRVLLVVQEGHVAREPHDAGQLPLSASHPPLPVATWAEVLLPGVAPKEPEELVVPAGGPRRPRPLETAGEGVLALAAAAHARPRVRGVLQRRRPGAEGARAVRLAEGVAAADERHRLRVVHAHAAKGVADVSGAARGVGIGRPAAVRLLDDRALGVEVDEADGGASQGLRARAVHFAGRVLLLLGARTEVEAVRAVG
mmetsp:Transcript_97870/g.310407  ORF Transcript_97870/g.310407 Transcript_97870/m.310407 type:complete len:269 (+) Transcript_97870:185-991(+)